MEYVIMSVLGILAGMLTALLVVKCAASDAEQALREVNRENRP